MDDRAIVTASRAELSTSRRRGVVRNVGRATAASTAAAAAAAACSAAARESAAASAELLRFRDAGGACSCLGGACSSASGSSSSFAAASMAKNLGVPRCRLAERRPRSSASRLYLPQG